MTTGQMVIAFWAGCISVFYILKYVPFLGEISFFERISASLLTGTVFIASSVASTIAVINELRAKGPFTQTALGTTIVKDVLVIVAFSINISLAEALIFGKNVGFEFALYLLIELLISIIIGAVFSFFIQNLLKVRVHIYFKSAVILFLGYMVFFFSHFFRDISEGIVGVELNSEPLLSCIIAGFYITNYSRFRREFLKIVKDTGPLIYVVFFTLTGSGVELDVLLEWWPLALALFGIRLVAMILASVASGRFAGEKWKFNSVGWMPYITQAGIGLGLVTLIADRFTGWGPDLATIIIAVIVVNELTGPVLFKWALSIVGETHTRAAYTEEAEDRSVIIFGLEKQGLALGRQLRDLGWHVRVATMKKDTELFEASDMEIFRVQALTESALRDLKADKMEVIVALKSDDEANFKICEIAFEKFGTKNIVVKLNHRHNYNRFNKLGCKIIEPSSAMVNLMAHFVRAPRGTALLLGLEKSQDTVDVTITNPAIIGLTLREMRLPPDILVLSVTRYGKTITASGFTRLRRNDVITLVGPVDSIENVRLRVEA